MWCYELCYVVWGHMLNVNFHVRARFMLYVIVCVFHLDKNAMVDKSFIAFHEIVYYFYQCDFHELKEAHPI